jgi:hypothetical protein
VQILTDFVLTDAKARDTNISECRTDKIAGVVTAMADTSAFQMRSAVNLVPEIVGRNVVTYGSKEYMKSVELRVVEDGSIPAKRRHEPHAESISATK